MKIDKKALVSLLGGAVSALTLFVPPARAAALTEPEQQVLQDCEKNVTVPAGPLSPQKAAECVENFNADDGALMEKFKDNSPVKAVEVVARNNALVDLQVMITKYSGAALARSLTRVIGTENCVPCEMGLGPQPEKLSPWVRKSIPERESYYDLSIRKWDCLGDKRTMGLSAEGHNAASWSGLRLMDRYLKLYDWAKKETDRLVAASVIAVTDKASIPDLQESVDILKQDLYPYRDWVRCRKLDELMKGFSVKAADTALKKPSASDKKGEEIDKTAAALAASRTAGDEKDFLDRGFDNFTAGKGGSPAVGLSLKGNKDFKPVPITEAQAAQLAKQMAVVSKGRMSGSLAAELRGTKAGDEILAFYENPAYAANGANKLNFGFQKGTGEYEETLGWTSDDWKAQMINTDVVDQYTKDRGITPAQLLRDKKMLRDFTVYVAPTFIHESTHQRQAAWFAAKGLDYNKNNGRSLAPYQMEMETEAFGMSASFTAEKIKKGGAVYAGKFPWWERAEAEKYLRDGVEGLRTEKHTADFYAKHADSIPGAASKELRGVASIAGGIAYYEEKARMGKLTEKESATLKEYKEILDVRFSWYRQALQKSKDDEKKLLAWRAGIDADGKALGAYSMPSL